MRRLWRRRQWAYAAYMVVAVLRLPARTRFHLVAPQCDWRLTIENAELSLTKLPHVALFGLFFVLTTLQFDRFDRRALGWSVAATAALGLLVELEEGATRTGNCRVTDVLPDIAGALVAAVALASVVALHARYRGARASAS